ncbi:MAG: SpoIIE family protein phosphatase, partial [Alphaproteobacteria bacterium]
LERLTDRLVLVGYTAAGGLDERLSPLGVLAPGVDVHRQALEGVFDGTLLTRPRWAPGAEVGVAVLLALLAAFAPHRFGVSAGGAIGFGVALAPLPLALAAYAGLLLVFDAAIVSAAAIVAGLPGFFAQILIADRERRQSEAERARIDGEMAAAKRMQMGILPDASTAFPGETRFSIAATTEPARTVGGDLFDFFLLDDRRLFFLVGDVAGKGPEASLFMAISKQLTKSAALRCSGDVGRVLTEANAEIARDNPAMMFVTVFAGVLDVETGDLDYCCAGHEPPWRVSAGGAAERLGGDGGPPLCLLDAFDYPTDRIRLAPGDLVVVVTDGVTEAANRTGELFGVVRTEAAVRRLVGEASAKRA